MFQKTSETEKSFDYLSLTKVHAICSTLHTLFFSPMTKKTNKTKTAPGSLVAACMRSSDRAVCQHLSALTFELLDVAQQEHVRMLHLQVELDRLQQNPLQDHHLLLFKQRGLLKAEQHRRLETIHRKSRS